MAASSSSKPSLTRSNSLSRLADGGFYWGTLVLAGVSLVLAAWIALELYRAASPSIHKFGAGFLTSTVWKNADDPIKPDTYGAWPYIWGTLYSAFLALLLAVPIGVGTAVFLAELAPKWMRTPLSFTVELLAAVPSVVYGLWGRLVLCPALFVLQTGLSERFPDFFLFQGSPQGQSMMAGGLILAIMILPFITAVSREVIKAVPPTQREAAFGLGATHWEAVKGPILKTARSGIIGAIILGLARALGETMAITMVIGNGDKNTSFSLFAPANTLASKIALEFNEASGLQQQSLLYLALVLFGITIVVNAFARLLLWNMTRQINNPSIKEARPTVKTEPVAALAGGAAQ